MENNINGKYTEYKTIGLNFDTPEQPKAKKVIAYVRVSTDAQSHEDKFGLDEQKEIIQQYCDINNMEIVHWYIDTISGTQEFRPELDKILYDDISNPPVEAVVVAKSDRMARDIKLYFYYMMLLEKRNIQLLSATEEVVGAETGLGNIYQALILFVAEMERENIKKRTSGGRRQKAKQGGYAGGKPPYGYKVHNSRLVIDKKEAEVVIKMFRLRAKGKPYEEIVERINYDGYKTRGNKGFTYSTVYSIITNENTYKGMYKYGSMKEWVQGQHEPILTEEILEDLERLQEYHELLRSKPKQVVRMVRREM